MEKQKKKQPIAIHLVGISLLLILFTGSLICYRNYYDRVENEYADSLQLLKWNDQLSSTNLDNHQQIMNVQVHRNNEQYEWIYSTLKSQQSLLNTYDSLNKVVVGDLWQEVSILHEQGRSEEEIEEAYRQMVKEKVFRRCPSSIDFLKAQETAFKQYFFDCIDTLNSPDKGFRPLPDSLVHYCKKYIEEIFSASVSNQERVGYEWLTILAQRKAAAGLAMSKVFELIRASGLYQDTYSPQYNLFARIKADKIQAGKPIKLQIKLDELADIDPGAVSYVFQGDSIVADQNKVKLTLPTPHPGHYSDSITIYLTHIHTGRKEVFEYPIEYEVLKRTQ